ncbi:MAG: YfhO family protein [Clostridiales bacterium]|nr:YfhO family protein [Clostridiales bacterium]
MKTTLNGKKNDRLRALYLLLPPFFTVLIFTAIYIVNGIYPFGYESVVYYDMGQCNVPVFYTVWDAIHSGGGVLFNWNTAGGIFINGSFDLIINPVNFLFFLICPRDLILQWMSFFVMLKFALSSFTAMLFFDKKFNTDKMLKIVFSVMYGFNAYVLQYYTNPTWLDVVAVFPLIIYALDRVFEKRRIVMYAVVLAFCLSIQLYISYMVYFFLFIVGGLYIFIVLPKKKRGAASFDFALGSVSALILSSFSAIPAYIYTSESSRYETATSKSYFTILGKEMILSYDKIGMAVILTALPTALLLILLIKAKKEKKAAAFFASAAAVCVLPVVFENINLFWHMGSYVNFPMRFAFMMHFTLLTASCYTVDRFGGELFKNKKPYHIGAFVCAVLAGAASCYLIFTKLFADKSEYKILYADNINVMISIFIGLAAAYFLMLMFGKKEIACILICAFAVTEVGSFANRTFSKGRSRLYEYSLSFIDECNVIYDELDIENDRLSRIKNIDARLNTNYPLILDYPSMSNFTHVIPATIKQSMKKLGYSTVYTRILDTGGTLFTDALLNYKYVLSSEELPQSKYQSLGEVGDMELYMSRYRFSFGATANSDIVTDKVIGTDVFKTNNYIANSITGKYSCLFTSPDHSAESADSEYTYTVDVRGKGTLYAAFSTISKRDSIEIHVNGEKLPVPSLGKQWSTAYPERFNNSIMNLGDFENEEVTVKIVKVNEKFTFNNFKAYFSLMDNEKLSEICREESEKIKATAGKRSLDVKVTAGENDDYLFLPITNNVGWSCTVNGRDAEIETAIGNFIAVKLEKGDNEVNLKFFPAGMKPGIVISLLALLGLLFIFLFEMKNKNRKHSENKFYTIVQFGYFAALSAVIILMYIIPAGVSLYQEFIMK